MGEIVRARPTNPAASSGASAVISYNRRGGCPWSIDKHRGRRCAGAAGCL